VETFVKAVRPQEKFPVYFRVACILTNYIHRRRMDMDAEDIQIVHNEDENGWDGTFKRHFLIL
jgi:hypothetical protein